MNSFFFFVKMLVCSKTKVRTYLKLVSFTFQHSCRFSGKSMCLLSLTASHSHVIVVVSSLILNKNSQKLLPSRAPTHLQSRRILHFHFLHKYHGNSPACP